MAYTLEQQNLIKAALKEYRSNEADNPNVSMKKFEMIGKIDPSKSLSPAETKIVHTAIRQLKSAEMHDPQLPQNQFEQLVQLSKVSTSPPNHHVTNAKTAEGGGSGGGSGGGNPYHDPKNGEFTSKG